MAVRKADAEWKGGLKDGSGTFAAGTGAFSGSYSFGTRFEEMPGTNPEELIGAALASCFSMALSGALGRANHPSTSVKTTANVHLAKVSDAFTITTIELDCTADVPGISDEEFQQIANKAKESCPVSRALGGTKITLNARLA